MDDEDEEVEKQKPSEEKALLNKLNQLADKLVEPEPSPPATPQIIQPETVNNL